MQTSLPALEPIVSGWMAEVLSKPHGLNALIAEHGSPVNLLQTNPFLENQKAYSNVISDLGLRHGIYFARKANKALCFVKAAKTADFGVDTASYNELHQCLEAGMNPQKLIVTAAVKNRELLEMAVAHGVPVMLDNTDECSLLQDILTEQGKTLEVGFRLGGFRIKGRKLYSRFGFDADHFFTFAREHLRAHAAYDRLIYRGLHFHLNGYSIEERALAAHACIDIARQLTTAGLHTDYIDLGGGILMNYLRSEEQWTHFHTQLRAALKADRSEITFRNDPLGMYVHQGEPLGEPNVYPYWNASGKEHFLKKVLQWQHLGQPLHERFAQHNIEVRLEPGRSLLDQCGMTVAKVAFRKYDFTGRLLIGLEMNRTQMRTSSEDFLVDPVFVPLSEQKEDPCEGYLVGAYCLEQELILKRKIRFPHMPMPGDLVCFVNTAGYFMHFYESEAHLFPLAKNIVPGHSHEWQWSLDQ